MGLKFMSQIELIFYLSWLKSDQNGIEIRPRRPQSDRFLLKSDQNGIEMILLQFHTAVVK